MNIEKIIMGLDCCSKTVEQSKCEKCPYNFGEDIDCIDRLCSDALELIKSQQSELDELHTCIQYQIDKAYEEMDDE